MKHILVTGVVFLALTAVAIAVDTKTDYDHSADFSKFRTFAWKAAKPDNNGNGVVTNSLVLSRIHDSVAEELRSKGLVENRNNPDLYVVTHVGAENQQDIDYWP